MLKKKKRSFKKIMPIGAGILSVVLMLQAAVFVQISASSVFDVSKSDVSFSDVSMSDVSFSDVSRSDISSDKVDDIFNKYIDKEISASSTVYYAESEFTIDMEEIKQAQEFTLKAYGASPIGRSSTQYNGSFRSELDALGKEIYDLYVDEYATSKTNNPINNYVLTNPIEFDVVLTEGGVLDKTGDSYVAAMNTLTASFRAASAAFAYDYPDVYWIGEFKFSCNIPYTDVSGSINSITITPCESYSGAYTEFISFNTGVDAAYNAISNSLGTGASRYNTVKAIHDYVCNNAKYDHDAATDENAGLPEYADSHTAAPLFAHNDKIFVCEGYAKAFKVLCDKFKIPCVLVGGTGGGGAHMWNYVQMEDGNWYAVDATWNDQDQLIYHTYFLVGKNTVVFNDAKFSEDHFPSGDFSGDGTMEFVYPPLSDEAYGVGGGTTTTSDDTSSDDETTTTTTTTKPTTTTTTTTKPTTTTTTTTKPTTTTTTTTKPTTTTTTTTKQAAATTTTTKQAAATTTTTKQAAATTTTTKQAAATTKKPVAVTTKATTTVKATTTTVEAVVEEVTTTTTTTTTVADATTTTANDSAVESQAVETTDDGSGFNIFLIILILLIIIILIILIILFLARKKDGDKENK